MHDVGTRAVLDQLKDFQRITSEHVFRRLYVDDDRTNRFLVADEVGLGKTLIARGVIAQAVDHLADQVERVDIVYVCSNLQIAGQNLQRLQVPGVAAVQGADRITLLPLRSRQLGQHRFNIVSMTPGTSMALKGGSGWSRERAVLRLVLKEAWGHHDFRSRGSMRIFQGAVRKLSRFDAEYRNVEREHAERLDHRVVESLAKLIDEHDLKHPDRGLRARFHTLCETFSHARPKSGWTDRQRWERNRFIGDLRHLLARASLEILEPDLVILDEFQRFKGLLAEPGSENADPASELAHELFSYVDRGAGSPAKVLLLSATPYRMLTRAVDDEDDHHADLVETASFLLDQDDAAVDELRHSLSDLRRSLMQVGVDRGAAALRARHRVESVLRRVMVRTERLASDREGSGMLVEPERQPLDLTVDEVDRYVSAPRLAKALESPNPVEYWKSAPYLLNFMHDYKMKKQFEETIESSPDRLASLVRTRDLVDFDTVNGYKPISLPNARLRRLVDETVGRGTWRLLWIPPSLPYVEPTGPYADPAIAHFTKRLVFSSWTMVPPMISTLVTYEAERRMVDGAFANTPEDRSRRARLLDFARSNERLSGLPTLALLYPSPTLAAVGAQLPLIDASGMPVAVADARAAIRWRIAEHFDTIRRSIHIPTDGAADERWYWAAPMWMDHLAAPDDRFFADDPRQLALYFVARDGADPGKSFVDHLDEAERTYFTYPDDLGRPPDDLIDVLTDMALAAPGTVALRTLARASGRTVRDLHLRRVTCRVGWAFRALFNGPEVITMVRNTIPGDRYWQQVIAYCLAGNLEAVLDEFLHVLAPSQGHLTIDSDAAIEQIANGLHDAIHIRTVNYSVSEIRVDGETLTVHPAKMRANYAVRLSDERADDGKNARISDVRDSFNSPFWPFVLAMTSAGQEGLDFHLYSHAIVHWNLPGSPVDLEQREGRVHRFKGHAVRKNLAKVHRAAALGADGNPWDAMFEAAHAIREDSLTDIVPFWVYTTDGGAAIERHVPAWELSKDKYRAATLKRAVAIYRLAFGQPRQDDLLAYLQGTVDETELASLVDRLKVDLSPPRHARS